MRNMEAGSSVGPRTGLTRRLTWLCVFLALGAIAYINYLERVVRSTARVKPSPVHYIGPWRPEKAVYHPGQTVRYLFTRDLSRLSDEAVVIRVESSFRDLDNHHTYDSSTRVRSVKRGDSIEYVELDLPEKMKSTSQLIVEGAVFSFPELAVQPEFFTALPIQIEQWGSEQERHAARRPSSPPAAVAAIDIPAGSPTPENRESIITAP